MVEFRCLNCNGLFDVKFWWELPTEVECPHCHSRFETDWDEGEDSGCCWLAGPVHTGDKR